jgi:hypothetical protein
MLEEPVIYRPPTKAFSIYPFQEISIVLVIRVDSEWTYAKVVELSMLPLIFIHYVSS